jgi:hypothetical protein
MGEVTSNLRFIMGVAVFAEYANWRGETSVRRIMPLEVYHGSTEWHPQPGWLLRAFDYDKHAERDFALDAFLSVRR